MSPLLFRPVSIPMTRALTGPAAMSRVRTCPTRAPEASATTGPSTTGGSGRGGVRGGEPAARAQPVGVEGMRAEAPRRVGLAVVLHGARLDRLGSGDARCRGGDGERLAAERPCAAARCLADADGEVELADGLADGAVDGLAEREEGDREPGRDRDLGDHGRAAPLLPQHVAESQAQAAGHPGSASGPLRAASRSSQPAP